MPKIDVVMPIGHWSPHLAVTLASLKAQSRSFDLLVQDATKDERVKNEFEKSGLAVRDYYKEADDGQADAIAKGWSRSDNEIVFWLNADDMLMPSTMDFVQKRFASDKSLDVVCGQSTISNEDGVILGLHPEVTRISPLLKKSNIISQPSCFVRRDAMEAVGGVNADLEYTMDWDLWLRLFMAEKKFEYVDDVFSNVTWETGTKTSRIPMRRLSEIYKLLRQSSSAFTAFKGLIGVFQHHQATYSRDKVELSTQADQIKNVPVLNLSSRDQNRLQIDIENLSDQTQCTCAASTVDRVENGFVIQLEKTVAPGQCTEISIECPTGASDIFKRAYWG